VASWGNRGLTRRIARRYGARRSGRTLLTRALDAARYWGVRGRAAEADTPQAPPPLPAAAAAAAAADEPAVALLETVASTAEERRRGRAAAWARPAGEVWRRDRPVPAPPAPKRPWWKFGFGRKQ